jgi:hypothetical protein
MTETAPIPDPAVATLPIATLPISTCAVPVQISWSDLNTDSVTARVGQIRAARQVPLIQEVGAPIAAGPSGALSWLRGSVGTLALAGLVGALLVWAIDETILQPDAATHWYGDSTTTSNVIFTLVFVLGIGLVISAWEGAEARSWAKAGAALLKAVPVLICGGLVGGFITNAVYTSMVSNIYADANAAATSQTGSGQSGQQIALQYVQDHMHLPRGIAFAIVGLAVGAALGAASRSGRRALNGAIGGFVGGFVGGFLFDYIGAGSGSGVMSRLVATVLTGVLVGVSMGLIETARREHWLEIVSGGMAGKQFILYHQQTVIGSGANCQVTLIKDPAVSPQQLQLTQSAAGLTARSLDTQRPAQVNGSPILEQTLADSDLLQVGSTVLRYRSKAASAPLPGAIRG